MGLWGRLRGWWTSLGRSDARAAPADPLEDRMLELETEKAAELAEIDRLIEDQPDEAGRAVLRGHRLEAETVLADLEGAARARLMHPARADRLDASRKERQRHEVEWVQSGGADRERREREAEAERREASKAAPAPRPEPRPAPADPTPRPAPAPEPEPDRERPKPAPRPKSGGDGPSGP